MALVGVVDEERAVAFERAALRSGVYAAGSQPENGDGGDAEG